MLAVDHFYCPQLNLPIALEIGLLWCPYITITIAPGSIWAYSCYNLKYKQTKKSSIGVQSILFIVLYDRFNVGHKTVLLLKTYSQSGDMSENQKILKHCYLIIYTLKIVFFLSHFGSLKVLNHMVFHLVRTSS